MSPYVKWLLCLWWFILYTEAAERMALTEVANIANSAISITEVRKFITNTNNFVIAAYSWYKDEDKSHLSDCKKTIPAVCLSLSVKKCQKFSQLLEYSEF